MLSDEVLPFMVDFKDRMLLSDAELRAVFQNTELPGCYVDPILEHDPVQYAGFVADMYRCKLARFDVTPVSKCGLFFVSKKPKPDGTVRLRLVIDARRSNRLFREPPWCPLSSGESLARMEISGTCYTAQEDVWISFTGWVLAQNFLGTLDCPQFVLVYWLMLLAQRPHLSCLGWIPVLRFHLHTSASTAPVTKRPHAFWCGARRQVMLFCLLVVAEEVFVVAQVGGI